MSLFHGNEFLFWIQINGIDDIEWLSNSNEKLALIWVDMRLVFNNSTN